MEKKMNMSVEMGLLKLEMRRLLAQFIEPLNQNAKDYFNSEVDKMVDATLQKLLAKEEE